MSNLSQFLGNSGPRNRIINGDMRIDQRFGGSPATFGAGGAYVLDRWLGSTTIANNMQFQRVSDAPTGFTNSHKVTALTGATITSTHYFVLIQSVEGHNISDLGFGATGAQSVTLSFWVKSSVTGTHSGSIRNGDFTRSYPFTYSISSSDTWEKKSVTIPGDTTGTWLTTNAIGLSVIFDLGTGPTYRGTAGSWYAQNLLGATGAVSPMATSGATWYVTGVQLEPGIVATPFERRLIGTEVALCQRYYHQTSQKNDFYGRATTIYNVTAFHAIIHEFPVTMRRAPDIDFAGANFTYANCSLVSNSTTTRRHLSEISLSNTPNLDAYLYLSSGSLKWSAEL